MRWPFGCKYSGCRFNPSSTSGGGGQKTLGVLRQKGNYFSSCPSTAENTESSIPFARGFCLVCTNRRSKRCCSSRLLVDRSACCTMSLSTKDALYRGDRTPYDDCFDARWSRVVQSKTGRRTRRHTFLPAQRRGGASRRRFPARLSKKHRL